MPILHDPNQNRLLAALPPDVFDRIAPDLELVSMPLGEVLHESGRRMLHAYFPTTAIASLHCELRSGDAAEIAGVGHEGVLGVALFLGEQTTPNLAIVQTAGYGYRMPASPLLIEFNLAGPMMHLMLRYTQALITLIAQTAVCNRYHSIEQQLCRWLLLMVDRMPSGELTITQELIAGMLGVRREGITEAAGHLQRRGLIRYRRGHITVIDRAGLESHSCECYAVVKQEFDRLFKEPQSGQTLVLIKQRSS